MPPTVKISELPEATAINAADVVVIVQGGVTKKAARSLLPDLVSNGDDENLLATLADGSEHLIPDVPV